MHRLTFFNRYQELRALAAVIVLVGAAFGLTEAGLAYRTGTAVAWRSAPWLETVAWYSLALLAASLLLGLFRPKANQQQLPLVGLLGGLSLALLYRLPTPAWDAAGGELTMATANMWTLRRQTLLLAAGLGVMLLAVFWPGLITWLRRYRRLVMLLGLGLLLATALFGRPAAPGGPRVTLDLGLFHFQPAEPIKLLFVIYLAGYLSQVRPAANRFSYRLWGLPLPRIRYLWPLLLVLGAAIVFLIWMSDLGAALILIGVFPVMIYAALHRRIFRRLVTLFGLCLLALYFLLVQVQDHTRSDITAWLDQPAERLPLPQAIAGRVTQSAGRVQGRIENWRDPWAACPGGNAACPSYQTLQAIYAVAAGGLTGTGPGLGQPQHIPAAYTDLIFAALVEEWGGLGGAAVLLVYLYLLQSGGRIARRQPESFNSLLALGLVAVLATQLVVIIGGTLNLLPLTGITVPFLSYGGTSLLVNGLLVGLLLRLSAGPANREATAETRHTIERVLQFYGLGLGLLLLGLGYWTIWLRPELYPAFPRHDARASNPAAWQRQTQWLANVTRGQIKANDGALVAVNRPEERVNLYPSLGHVVGQVDERGLGVSGLEYSYNATLLGQGRYDPETLWAQASGRPWLGNDLQLTIDLTWQQAAHEELGEHTGALVVLDAKSGAVLAMVSHPLFDSADQGSARQLNRAIAGLYPPGSTFKTVTGALALDNDLVRPDTAFDFGSDDWYWAGGRLCHQRLIGGGVIVSCNTDLQQMTFSQGFAWSDNILFAQLAGQLGPEAMWHGVQNFGFGRPVPFDLPVEPAQLADQPAWLYDEAQLAMTGFGQSRVLATPLHMALVAAAIANQGQLPQPHVVQAVLRPDGSPLYQVEPETWQQAVSRAAARQMRQVMIEATAEGWAATAAVEGLVVGGKTGTAEWAGTTPHSWFIGFADLPEDRTVAIAVIAEGAGEGSQEAAPIAGAVLRRMARPEPVPASTPGIIDNVKAYWAAFLEQMR